MKFVFRKEKMDNATEKAYYEFLLELVADDVEGMSQRKILREVNNNPKFKESNIKQSEISRDFKHLNIVKVKEMGKNVYRYVGDSPAIGMPDSFQHYLDGNSTIFKQVRCLRIPVKTGSEEIVCKEIIGYFKNGNIICIPAYKSVCIITNSKDVSMKKIEYIQEKLNAIHKHRNK